MDGLGFLLFVTEDKMGLLLGGQESRRQELRSLWYFQAKGC